MGSAGSRVIVKIEAELQDGKAYVKEFEFLDGDEDFHRMVRFWIRLSRRNDCVRIDIDVFVTGVGYQITNYMFAYMLEKIKEDCAGIHSVAYDKIVVSGVADMRVAVDLEKWVAQMLAAGGGVQRVDRRSTDKVEREGEGERERERKREDVSANSPAKQTAVEEEGNENDDDDEDEDDEDTEVTYPKQIMFGSKVLQLDWISSQTKPENLLRFYVEYKRSQDNLCSYGGYAHTFSAWPSDSFISFQIFKEFFSKHVVNNVVFMRDPALRIIVAFAFVEIITYRIYVKVLCTHGDYKTAQYQSSRPLGYIILDEIVCSNEDMFFSRTHPTYMVLEPVTKLKQYYTGWLRPDYDDGRFFYWGNLHLFSTDAVAPRLGFNKEVTAEILQQWAPTRLYLACSQNTPGEVVRHTRHNNMPDRQRHATMWKIQFGKTPLLFSRISRDSSNMKIEYFYRNYKRGESEMCVNGKNHLEFYDWSRKSLATLANFKDMIASNHMHIMYLLDPAERRIAAFAKILAVSEYGDYYIQVMCAHSAYKRLVHNSTQSIGHVLLNQALCTMHNKLTRPEDPVILYLTPKQDLEMYYSSWMQPDIIADGFYYWGLFAAMTRAHLEHRFFYNESRADILTRLPSTSHLTDHFQAHPCVHETVKHPIILD